MLLRTQRVEVIDDGISLGPRIIVAALVLLDCDEQICSSSVMHEEDSLPESPKWSGAELIWTSSTLHDSICEPGTQVVNQQIRIQIEFRVIERSERRGVSSSQAGRVAESAAHDLE